MSTLSFISNFCSPGALPVQSSDTQRLACFIRVRFYCGVLQGFAELGGFELRDGGSVIIATLCRDWQGKIIKDNEHIADDEPAAKIAHSEDCQQIEKYPQRGLQNDIISAVAGFAEPQFRFRDLNKMD